MKILVIADDLTGAAEIGGIVLRYGLSVEIVHALTMPADKDVQILNTNTRSSLKEEDVLAHLERLFPVDSPSGWDWIYLKFDSALRGNIKREISFYRAIFQKDNVVFCPVNPAMKRFIQDGIYGVEGTPIAETDFARDPEFPITKSGVLEAIGASSWHLAEDVPTCSNTDQPYVVAAVKDEEGLHRWAASPVSFGLYAGAAAFFDALLQNRMPAFPIGGGAAPILKSPVLYICGSNHENSAARIAKTDADKVVYWQRVGQERELARKINEKLGRYEKLVFAIAPSGAAHASAIRESMAAVLALVQNESVLQELVIEGGATARAILEALAIDTLLPVWEYGQGVIRNRVPEIELMITLKPGSYPWTKELWAF